MWFVASPLHDVTSLKWRRELCIPGMQLSAPGLSTHSALKSPFAFS